MSDEDGSLSLFFVSSRQGFTVAQFSHRATNGVQASACRWAAAPVADRPPRRLKPALRWLGILSTQPPWRGSRQIDCAGLFVAFVLSLRGFRPFGCAQGRAF